MCGDVFTEHVTFGSENKSSKEMSFYCVTWKLPGINSFLIWLKANVGQCIQRYLVLVIDNMAHKKLTVTLSLILVSITLCIHLLRPRYDYGQAVDNTCIFERFYEFIHLHRWPNECKSRNQIRFSCPKRPRLSVITLNVLFAASSGCLIMIWTFLNAALQWS